MVDSLPVDRPRVMVLNTLGAALLHYSSELRSVLETTGHEVEVVSITEPSSSGRSAWSWLRDYVSALLDARSRADPETVLIVTWPVLGYIDVAIIALAFQRRAIIVVHDTMPLTRAIGYGRMWQWVSATLRGRVGLLLHSEEALVDVLSNKLRQRAQIVPHPIRAPRPPQHLTSKSTAGTCVIRVLGQYKPDRDIEALREIARQLDSGYRLEVVGRHWPQIDGWSVKDAFVSEGELDDLIATSDAVIIPYQRFYQSGIAIRCLEHNVPVVGPARSSLATLCGSASKLLVDEDQTWSDAVRHAVSTQGQTEATLVSRRWRAHALDNWSRLALLMPTVLPTCDRRMTSA